MHLKTQLAVIENNSTAWLGSKNYFSHSAKCATPYSFGARFKMTSKIVFPCLQKVDNANNYCKKPGKVIASTVALMLYNIVLVYIIFVHGNFVSRAALSRTSPVFLSLGEE